MPDTPLIDRNSLETTFGQYNANTRTPDIPQQPFQGLPSPDSIFGTSEPISPLEQMEQNIFAKEKQRQDGKLTSGSIPFSFKDLQSNRYSAFNPDPNYDNEDAFAQSQSFWDKAANGVIKMGGIAGSTAISSSLGLINGAIQWADTGKFSSFYDNEFTHSLDDFNKSLEDKFPHYTTAHERASDWYEPSNLFTANFLFDKIIKNLGFAIGAAVPAGAIGRGLQAMRISSNLFAAGEALAATEAIEAASQLPRIQQLSTISSKLRGIAGTALKGLGAPQVNGQEAAGFLVKALSSTLASSGEASLEAYNNLNEFRNDRIKEYKLKYNQDPTGIDLENINKQAENVGNASFGFNMALLSGTEYVQLPKIFSSTFKGEKALLNETVKNAETGLLETVVPKNKKLFQGRNIASLFFNAPEAFEEGAQYGIQKGTENYYNKKYRGQDTDFISALSDAVHEGFFSKEGLENVILGGLSGALMTARGKVQERGFDGLGGQKAANTDAFISDINKFRFSKYLKEGVDQANRATVLQQERERAIRQGNILESKDLEFDYAHNYLSHRIKWDRFDLVQDDIADMRNEAASIDGFQRLQEQGRAAQTDTQATFTARLNNFERHANSVKNSYEALNNKYSNTYATEVIDQLVYASAKVEDYDKRIQELSIALSQKGIQVQQVLEEALSLPISEKETLRDRTAYEKAIIKEQKGEELTPIRQALKDINSLNTISEVKDDLKQQLQDTIELAIRRKNYIKDYADIKENPDKYKEIIASKELTNIATIKQRNAEGKSIPQEVEVGKTYAISSPGLFRDGNKLSINPKLTILSKTLGNEFEVLLPDGSTTFLKPNEFKDYKITEDYENIPELDQAIEKVIDEEVKAKGLESLLAPEDTLQDKLNIVNSLINKPLIDAIQRRVKQETQELQKRIEEELKKKEKFKKDQELQKQFFSTVKALEGEEPTLDPTSEEDADLSPKKDLSFIASTGTSQRYENALPDSPARREQTFLLNLSKPPLAQKNIKTLLVTKNTEGILGLSGIIDPQYPDAIRIVYVEVNDDGSFHYLDKEGNPLLPSNIDIQDVVFGTMHDESLTFNQGQTSYTNKQNLDEEKVKANYKKFREQVFSITPEQMIANPSQFFTSFTTSRGLPNIANSSSENNILDVNLIAKEDLFSPIVTIPTQGKTVFGPDNDSVNMPLGKPLYNYKGNLFFLNNRNLTDKEATNIAQVLSHAIKQLIETGSVSSQLQDYLKGVIYFKHPQGKSTTRNQVYIEGNKLFIGDKGQSFDIFNLKEAELTTVLKAAYIYVDNKHLLDFAKNPQNTPFQELSIVNNIPTVTKTWPSYQHYLLEKREDGTPAPLTTNIIIPQSSEELPIIQKYPILSLQALETKNLIPSTSEQKAKELPAPSKPSSIVYDGTTINKALTSKGEEITFKATDTSLEIIPSDGVNEALTRLTKAGKTEDEAKALIAGVAQNAIIEDKSEKPQPPQKVREKKHEIEQRQIEASLDKKADIERRRQEELDDTVVKQGIYTNKGTVKTVEQAFEENVVSFTLAQEFDKINAKYDAELEALKNEEDNIIMPTADVQSALKEELNVTSPIVKDVYLSGLHYIQTQDGKYYVVPDINGEQSWESPKEVTQEQIIKPFRTKAEWDKIGTLAPKATSKFKKGKFDDSAKRLNIKSFTLQGNTKEEEEDVKRMLPNVDIVSLKNIINITGGGKAWGAALPNFIYIWEQAPYGTRYHEAFEQVTTYILNNKERKELYKEFRQREGSFITFQNKSKLYSEATYEEAKEQLADEFAEFRANGTLPTQPKAKSLIQKIWEFLKALFIGKPLSVETAFYNLAKGSYANSPIVAPIRTEPQYKRTVVDTPEALVQDTIIGMTSELFMKKWGDDTALLNQLEEEEQEATQTLFTQLYEGLNHYFTGEGDQTLNAYFYNQLTDTNQQELEELYDKIQSNWNNVSLQWGNYMEDLKSFLRVFDVAFTVDDNGEIALASDEQINEEERIAGPDGYVSEDRLFVNAKNSASKIVKLLFATVADSQFIFNITKNELGNTIQKYMGNVAKRDNNQMFMPNLAPYAKLFNYTLHNSANINGIENILSNLRKVSNNRNIKLNANLEVLLNRVGYDKIDPITQKVQKVGWENLSPASRKLLLKLENALSKQKPQFFIQYSPNKNEHRILATNISDRTEQLKELWVDAIKGSKYTTTSGNKIKFKPEVFSEDDFVFLSNLNIPFTKSQFDTLSGGKKTIFRENVNKIREDVKKYTNKFLPVDTTSTNIDFAGRLEKLAELYAQNVEGDTTESQHFNPAGKPTSSFILNNYVSFILNDTNQVSTLEEFKTLNPQYNDLYMGDSYILNNLLFQDGKRTEYDINVVISEGKRSQREGTPTSKLTYGERIIYEINNNLNDIYYTLLPADASTEWGLKIRNLLSPTQYLRGDSTQAIEEYTQTLWSTLKNEIELAKDFDTNTTRSSIASLNQKPKGENRATGKSLRFFQSILSPKFVEEINQIIDNQGIISEEKYAQFKTELSNYIQARANETINNLKAYQLINEKNGKIQLAGVDTDFLKRNFDTTKISPEQLNSLFFFREANYIFQNIEMHKFLFNDPAQYKDEEKRIKSFLSGRERSNQSEALNTINNTEFNKSGDYILKPNEYGYKNHSNKISVQTIATVKTTSQNIEEIEKALPGAAGKKYNDNDVADAQSWAEGSTYVEMLYKSGGRLTEAQKKLHEWLMAYQRNKMLDKGLLGEDNYSKELQKADNKLLKSPIPDASLPILKPIISGVRNENNTAIQYLYKTSTAPLYYYFVEGTPAENILLSMQKANIGLLAMDSAHKVGQLKNHTPSLYNEEGNISEYFSNSAVEIDYKYFGIQVETGGSKDYQKQGSQLAKLAVQNLMSNGVPIDFINQQKEKNSNISQSEIEKLWNNFEEKENNKIVKVVQKHNSLLSEMVVRRAQKVLDKLGIKKGEFGYTYEDRKKVADFILSELTRRELPTNLGVGIEVENNEFKSPLEANVNYRKIKELLWSVIENNITKPKVSGGPKILLSALGFDNIQKQTINGKDVLTSTKYKFYTQKDGKTQACQVAIPFYFGTKILAQIEKSQGIKFSSQKEGMQHVLDYLNKTEEGKSLLEGIGFRIPTQGLNSVDFFEVVEFLPPQMGDATIFPSEITTKAGSDFDVDKMNMYLKNFYLDANGYPKSIPYFGIDDNAKQRLSDFLFEETFKSLTNKQSLATEKLKNYFNLEEEDIDFEGSQLEEVKLQEKLFLQSLENEYYSTIKDILSLEENFARLITPNDANQLKTISQNIEKLKPEHKVFPLTNPSRFTDSNYVANKRHLFLIMKQAVGVAAVANTNLALNQVADFRMSLPKKLVTQNFAVRFKYNNTNDNTLSLSETKNKFGDWISDLHSQAIDGTVDVAKDEWLANLLGDANAFGPLLYMFKLGVSPKTAALFINQPSIQLYLRQKSIHQNISKIASWVKPKYYSAIEKDIQKSAGLVSKQVKALMASKPDIYSDKEMEDAIKNQDIDNLQIQILNDYRGFEELAKNLFTNVQGYNYDTSRFTSPEVVEDKKLQYQTALKTPSLDGGTNKILSSSFIGTVKTAIENTNEALSGLLNTQKGQAKRLLNKMALKLSIQFFSKDDKIKYLQKAENSLIDYLSQTQAEYANFKLNQLIPALFLKEGNIAQLVKAAQEHPLLQANPILRNIETVEDKREGYPSYIRLIEQDYDSYTSNVWTSAFRELRDSNIIVSVNGKNRSISQIYDYIIISQILQYGTSRTKGSFLHLIPNEDYTFLIEDTLKNINNIDSWLTNDLFYKNNYLDNSLVPEAELDYLEDGITEILPAFSNTALNKLLTENGYTNTTLITQPFDKRNSPFLKISTINRNSEGKITDVTDKTISLYRRVDEDENTPITIKSYNTLLQYDETKLLYVKVNKLGDANLKEYTETSYLPQNKPFKEISNEELTDLIQDAGISFSSQELTNLVASDDFEDTPPPVPQQYKEAPTTEGKFVQEMTKEDGEFIPITEITRGSKKEKYTITLNDGSVEEREGYKLKIKEYPNFQAFITKMLNDKWRVDEIITSKNIGVDANTIKEAIPELIETLNKALKNPANKQLLTSIGFEQFKNSLNRKCE